MKIASERQSGPTRRQILQTAILSLVTIISGLPRRSAYAQQKVSKAMVHYQERPKNGQECAGCVNFIPPSACKVVAGRINPHGWCELWVPKG